MNASSEPAIDDRYSPESLPNCRTELTKVSPNNPVLGVIRRAREALYFYRLPKSARKAWRCDLEGLPEEGPEIGRAIDEAVAWLKRAQSFSKSADGGVARHYGLIDGWSTSYPETTGYIVPTMLAYADWREDSAARACAKRMLDWLVSIQFAEGGFQGGRIDAKPVVPVTFNTGQILLGLAAGAKYFGEAYVEPMHKAARWLADTIDDDGCWRKHPTPFAAMGEKVYETHVAWGMFEADRVDPERGFGDVGLRNVAWAIQSQQANGWLANCCLSDPMQPLTHTLGYALRGMIEAHTFSGRDEILVAARKTADGLLSVMRPDGFLPGRLDANWTGTVRWACLTGTVQIAHCWLILFRITGDSRYRDAGFAANRFVRRTIALDGPDGTRGGVRGSFPISGDYGHLEYLNWAAKFFVDSCLLEIEIRETKGLAQE